MDSANNTIAEYNVYVTRLFRIIPKNCVIITKNRFNGSKVSVIEPKKRGFHFFLPWTKSKLVSLAVRNFDYPETHFEDSQGIEVVVDLVVTVRISDPIKYEYNNTNVEGELKQLIESQTRILISKCPFEKLKSSSFNVSNYRMNRYTGACYRSNSFDSVTGEKSWEPIDLLTEENADFIKAMCEFGEILSDFSSRYGLEVVDLYNKKVQQTREMQEEYDKKVKAQKEAERIVIEAEGRKEAAKRDAAAVQALNEAEIDKIAKMAEKLKDAGMSEDGIAKFLRDYVIANGKTNGNLVGTVAALGTALKAGLGSGEESEDPSKKK